MTIISNPLAAGHDVNHVGNGSFSAGGSYIASYDDPILITGASGFIGTRLVKDLLDKGFRNLRCVTRSSTKAQALAALREGANDTRIQVITGNLLSRADCAAATENVVVIFHLAAGRGEKSFPDAFMNSAVTTRNIIEASLEHRSLRRFVNVSSFSVYTNRSKPHGNLLDETCPVESHPEVCGDAYSFAKLNQDLIVTNYCRTLHIPYVIVRPGYVIGPGKPAITGRVGLDTFGFFMHLGGSNKLPLTYVDNCAAAIALAGLTKGVDSEVYNVVDDDLPSSRRFLRLYKRHVRSFKSIYVPHLLSYIACSLWERYSALSNGQLEPVFNRGLWHRYWKKTTYSNEKLKKQLGWRPRVTMADGLKRYFESCTNQSA
jgi:nucleoside-diphosphate-sugar epimerase